MGMQSLRFRTRSRRWDEEESRSRPPAALTFGICLLVGAGVVLLTLIALRFGLFAS